MTNDKDKFGTAYAASYPQLTSALPIVIDDGRGHKHYDLAVDISTVQNGKDGIISSVACKKISSPQDFMEIDWSKPIGTVAHCAGWWQEPGRNIQMDVSWYKTGYSCVPQPWPATRPH